MQSFSMDKVVRHSLWAACLCPPAIYVVLYLHWISEQGTDTAAQPTPNQTGMRTPLAPDFSRMTGLFGESVSAKQENTSVKETSLSLKLVASYVAGSNGRSAAVLAQNGGNHQLYFQGDTIMPGVQLMSVTPRRALIRRNAIVEKISLQEVSVIAPNKISMTMEESQARNDSAQPTRSGSIIEGNGGLIEKLAELRAAPIVTTP